MSRTGSKSAALFAKTAVGVGGILRRMELPTEFYLAEPPRLVPLTLRLQALLGPTGQFGWFFLGVGLAACWLVLPLADFSSWTVHGPVATASGRITDVRETGYSEGGRKGQGGTPIWAHDFEFVGPGGRTYSGTSYGRGRCYQAGVSVTVEYPPQAPDRACIRGMRRAPFSWTAGFVVIFPVVGAGAVGVQVRHGRQVLRLLRDGRLAAAKFVSAVRTATRINRQYVHRVTLQFHTDDGDEITATTRTTRPELLRDAPQERILYDPQRPKRMYPLDTLPLKARPGPDGHWAPGGAATYLLLILPLTTIVGHLAYASLRWGG